VITLSTPLHSLTTFRNSPLKTIASSCAVFFTHTLLLILSLLLFSCIFSCVNTAWASEQKPDLADALVISEDLSRKFTLADNSRLTDPKLFRTLLTELAQQKDHFTEADHHFLNYLQGYHFAYIGEHDKSEQKLKEILLSNASVQVKFRANYTLINLSAINHKWANGLQYVAANNERIKSITDEALIQSSLLATTLFYTSMKQYKLALNYITKLEQYDLSPHQQCFTTLYTLRAQYYLGQLNLHSNIIAETITLCINANNNIGANSARNYQARLYLASQQPQQALNLLLPYVEDVESTLLPMLIASVNNLIAQAYFQLNDMSKAKRFATEAMLLNKYNSGVQRARNSYKILYQVAEKQHDLALALSHYKQFAQLDKAFLDEVKTKHLAFQLAEHDSQLQASRIKLLNEKNKVLTTKQVLVESKIRNVQLLILALLLFLVLLVIWGSRLWRSHKRVKILSESDELTGIYNRRHFNYVATSALRYCKTAQQDLSVVMFDLDLFKDINDNYGHHCGDWALKETIRVCQAIGKTNDVFARLGGEEFCLLLPSTDIKEAYNRAEASRIAIEAIISKTSGSDFSLTASFGITDITRSGFRLKDLLKDADSAMYIAKKKGRNQVILFERPNQEQS
jgi:diguanylate cyclase (GGDEF)-like protein